MAAFVRNKLMMMMILGFDEPQLLYHLRHIVFDVMIIVISQPVYACI